MNEQHLTDDELNRALAGDTLLAELESHRVDCLVCRRRLHSFVAVVEAAMNPDPSEQARARVREAVLSRWSGSSRLTWRRWAVAIAAVVVLALVPLIHWHETATTTFNPDTVLAEVDQVLERDPLAALGHSELVEEILSDNDGVVERSVS